MNMYVSNLAFQMSDDDLRQPFEPFGQVSSAKVITDRESGRGRGFGFVEMSSDNEAEKAIRALNGKQVEGRAISVSVAREREERPKKSW